MSDKGDMVLKKKMKAQDRLIWLICFTSTLGAVPAGKVGNTYIPLAWVFAFAYLLYVIFNKRGRLCFASPQTHILLLAYVVYCGMTVILPYTAGISGHVVRAFKGLLVLVGNVSVFAAMTINPSPLKVRYMIGGLLAGVMLNAIYGIYQYIGSFCSLPLVNLPSPLRIADVVLLHRAQGFTSEPSVLASLLIPGILLAVGWGKQRWILLMSIMVTALVLTFSSGIIFLGVGGGLYFAAKALNRPGDRKVRLYDGRRLAVMTLVLLFVAVSVALLGDSSVRGQLGNIFMGASPFAAENKERLDSIRHSLGIWLKYPWGVGYNMGPTIMERFGYKPNIHSLFSGILLETGFLGAFLYLMFVLSPAYSLLRNRTSRLGDMLAIASVTSLLYSFATGVFLPFQMALWGVSTAVSGSYRGETRQLGFLRREINADPSL